VKQYRIFANSVFALIMAMLCIVAGSIPRDSLGFNKSLEELLNWDKSCKVMKTSPSEIGKVCKYGMARSGKILLIGDSQAASLSDALVKSTLTDDFEVWIDVFSGCPYFRGDSQEIFPSVCVAHNRHIEVLLTREDFDLIIYTFRSSISQKSKSVGDAYKEAVLDGINDLSESSKNLLILLPFPEIEFPANNFEFILNFHLRESSELKLQNSEEAAFWEEKLKNRVDFLQTRDFLCPRQICQAKIGDSVLYADSNHLTLQGALLLARPIETRFRIKMQKMQVKQS
jgi:hypothetical protein